MAKNAPIIADIFLKEVGIHETPGPAATARIIEYGKYTTLKPTSDEVPWCSDSLNFVVHKARELHPEIDVETRSAAAISWADWGEEVPNGEQDNGDVVIFEWSPGHHHVAVYLDENDDGIRVVGGNQSPTGGGPDAVCIKRAPLAAVIHFRRPKRFNG